MNHGNQREVHSIFCRRQLAFASSTPLDTENDIQVCLLLTRPSTFIHGVTVTRMFLVLSRSSPSQWQQSHRTQGHRVAAHHLDCKGTQGRQRALAGAVKHSPHVSHTIPECHTDINFNQLNSWGLVALVRTNHTSAYFTVVPVQYEKLCFYVVFGMDNKKKLGTGTSAEENLESGPQACTIFSELDFCSTCCLGGRRIGMTPAFPIWPGLYCQLVVLPRFSS